MLPAIGFYLRPKDEEFHAMLAQLGAALGWRATAATLGVSYLTMDSWRKRKNGPSAGARKLVWLVWSLVFQPTNMRSLFDIVTWGKLADSAGHNYNQNRES